MAAMLLDTGTPTILHRDRPAERPAPHPQPPQEELLDRAKAAALRARDFAYAIRKADGHWCAELESNTTVTAEYVFMHQALGLDLTAKRGGLVRYFFGQQKSDGSWVWRRITPATCRRRRRPTSRCASSASASTTRA